MNPDVDHFDHRAGEPPDRWHPEHDTVTGWLDAEAPVHHQAKQHNGRGSRYGKQINTADTTIACVLCHEDIATGDIALHLARAHPVRRPT
jgi:hypothetical protein